jgi:probable F420-dependent oxidoreductase
MSEIVKRARVGSTAVGRSPLTFGVSIRQDIAMRPDGTFDADGWADVVVHAERLGFDHVFAADHVFVPPYMSRIIGDVWMDPFTLLAYLAARTSRIELVFSCLVVPYRQPFAAAEAVATIDQLSGGRCALGVVPGYIREEFDTFNLALDERSAMTNEFVRLMRELWTSRSTTFQGNYYSCDQVDLLPKCVRQPHVPIWVGGSSRSAIRRVAEFGDVWHPTGFTIVTDEYRDKFSSEMAGKSVPTSGTTPKGVREGLAQVQRLADQSGRDISDLKVVVLPGVPEDEDGDGRRSSVEQAIRGGAGRDAMIDWLARYVEAGATGFYVSPRGRSLPECAEFLDRYAAEVIPALRQRTDR